jgi:hypothetical protein
VTRSLLVEQLRGDRRDDLSHVIIGGVVVSVPNIPELIHSVARAAYGG